MVSHAVHEKEKQHQQHWVKNDTVKRGTQQENYEFRSIQVKKGKRKRVEREKKEKVKQEKKVEINNKDDEAFEQHKKKRKNYTQSREKEISSTGKEGHK